MVHVISGQFRASGNTGTGAPIFRSDLCSNSHKMHYGGEVTAATAEISDAGYDRRILARMIDFFTIDGTPWPRRLWDVGSVLALEELWEAGAWAAEKVLSQGACDWQRAQLRTMIGPDLGLGIRELRQELTRLLSGAQIRNACPARLRPTCWILATVQRFSPPGRKTSIAHRPPRRRSPGTPPDFRWPAHENLTCSSCSSRSRNED